MSHPSFGPDDMPWPPRWLAIPMMLVLLAYAGFLGYVVVAVLIAILLPWQSTVVGALVIAAVLFALWHLLFGRRGC